MSELIRNELSRRRFLLMTSSGLAAAGLSALIGCSPEEEATTLEESESVVEAATPIPPTPTRGLQTLRFATATPRLPTQTLDPAVGLQNTDVICAMYEQLVNLDDGFKAQPSLAETWESNDALDVWTFHLRQDVTWHDGDKFTAKDVVYTYRRVLDPETASPGAAALSSLDPDGIEAVDDYTVRFTLASPTVDLPLAINTKFTFIIKDGATAEQLKTTDAVGTGPFKIRDFVPGEDPTVLVKNENYWQPGLPKIDVLELRAIEDPAARVAALTRGQVDIIEQLPLTEVQNLENNPDVVVISQPSGNWEGFVMMVDEAPFDDNRVRLALKHCIDRQKMIDLILLGRGRPAHDVPVPPWFEYGLEDATWEQDIAKAKSLLAEAGYEDGLDIELWTSTASPNWMTMAAVYKEMAAEAGINVELQVGAADAYWTEVWLKKPFVMTTWSARPADSILSLSFLSDSDWNETHFNDPDWDALILEARQTADYEQRKSLYQQAERIIMEEGGVLIPNYSDTLAATRNNVAGWKPQARFIFYDFSTVGFTG
jgi:peptide/nickel transport system substrate-binding protein